MKKLIFILALFASKWAFAQPKHNNIWVLGSSTGIPDDLNMVGYGGITLDFSFEPPKIDTFDFRIFNPKNISVMSDSNGKLLYHSSGCKIMNSKHEVMENGDSIVMPDNYFANKHCYEEYNFFRAANHSSLTLPRPDSSGLFDLFQMDAVEEPYLLQQRYYYSTVDMRANGGLGRVIKKHQVVLEDSLQNSIAAIRHGNGRDWWAIVPRGTDRQFWTFRVTPEGPKDQTLQTFESQDKWGDDYIYIDPESGDTFRLDDYEYLYEACFQQACFSSDGKKYARMVACNGLEIYDFDRCTGQLSLDRAIPMPFDSIWFASFTPVWIAGLAFSPDDRFLYFNTRYNMYQYDMNSNSNDYEFIAKYDGYLEDGFFQTNFHYMHLAPNGKIYVSTANGSKKLHTIHKPNEKGMACDFRQHDLHLPRWNYEMNDYFANYALLDLADSPCDSLGINVAVDGFEKMNAGNLLVAPVPADAFIIIELINLAPASRSWQLVNSTGQIIVRQHIGTAERFSIERRKNWPNGLYFLQILENGRVSVARKVIFE